MQEYIYGAMGTKYSITAPDKYIAYCTIVAHFKEKAHLVVIYEPKEAYEDNWVSPDGKIAAKLDNLFGGKKGAFDKYCQDNKLKIRECYYTIKQIV